MTETDGHKDCLLYHHTDRGFDRTLNLGGQEHIKGGSGGPPPDQMLRITCYEVCLTLIF